LSGAAWSGETTFCIFAENLGLVLGPSSPGGRPVTRNNVMVFMAGIFVQNNCA